MINVFNMYMKKKAHDDDLMFSKPPELLLLQVFTQLDFVDHLFIENNGHRPHFRKSSCPTSSDSGSKSECAVWWPWVIPGGWGGRLYQESRGYIKNWNEM